MPDFHVKRCFIALPLDETAVADLSDIVEGIEVEGLRRTKRDNIHITLKFLGDIEDPDIPGVIAALQALSAMSTRFNLCVTGLEYIPNARRPRVLAAVTDRPAAVLELYERVETAMFELGFPREGRAYTPHVTLGRFKRPPHRLPQPQGWLKEELELTVERLVLMESSLDQAGPTYTPLAEWELAKSQPKY